jgi:alcohol dehydrogenase
MLAFIAKTGCLVAVKKPQPRLAHGWALIRVRLAGICNTDLEILRGYHNFHGTVGHEFVGEVVEVKSRKRSEGKWVGRRVVGEINIACEGLGYSAPCSYCRRGIPTHCARRRVLGIVGHDGAFAEFLALPLVNLHRVPDSVADEAAVFTEPLAAACQILEQVQAREFERVAVLGDGKLAQLIARVLAAEGCNVSLFGKHLRKLALAHRARITTLLLGPARRHVPRPPARWPLVVEATGSPEGFAEAIQMVAPRGTLVLKSTFHGATHVETWPLVVNEVTLVGSRCGPFRRALDLLRSGRVDPRPLISRVFPLREAAAAIRYAARPGVVKVLLKQV